MELWATDEHRIGLKPLLRRVWAPIGKRPLAMVQHRFAWRYLVGFVHPASGRTVLHLATTVSIPTFEAELAEFARQVGASPSKQIVLVLDRAGGHTSVKLRVPAGTSTGSSCQRIPPSCSRPSTCGLWWPLTNTCLINRHFGSIEELEDVQFARCAVLQHQPERIRSTTLFHWWPKRIKKRQGPRSR